MSKSREHWRQLAEWVRDRFPSKRAEQQLRRKILEGLEKRINTRGKGQALRSKEALKLDSLSDRELEQAVVVAGEVHDDAARRRAEAGQLRREVFRVRTARRLLNGGAR